MKINIVVDKTLDPGRKANIAAIIMGQLGRDISSIYSNVITDRSGTDHAGISINVVILNGNGSQLLKLIESAKNSNVVCIAFSSIGQFLSNSYNEYQKNIISLNTEETKIVGVGIYGDDEVVKALTKKFSLAK